MNLYILQIVKHDDIGTIRDIKITHSYCKAETWLHKRLKTKSYSHGYKVIQLQSNSGVKKA